MSMHHPKRQTKRGKKREPILCHPFGFRLTHRTGADDLDLHGHLPGTKTPMRQVSQKSVRAEFTYRPKATTQRGHQRTTPGGVKCVPNTITFTTMKKRYAPPPRQPPSEEGQPERAATNAGLAPQRRASCTRSSPFQDSLRPLRVLDTQGHPETSPGRSQDHYPWPHLL